MTREEVTTGALLVLSVGEVVVDERCRSWRDVEDESSGHEGGGRSDMRRENVLG